MNLLESPGVNEVSSMGGSSKSTPGSSKQKLDTSGICRVMQVTIQDLCPFFCDVHDLEGKTFKEVRQREMLSPFTLFYNRQDIIELSRVKERMLMQEPERFVFKVFSKTEANLERTLLKVSFNDLDIFKGIANQMSKMLNAEYQKVANPQPLLGEEKSAFVENEGLEEAKRGLTLIKETSYEGYDTHLGIPDSDEEDYEEQKFSQEELSSEEDEALVKFKKIRNSFSGKRVKKTVTFTKVERKKSFHQTLRSTQQAISNIKRNMDQKFSGLNL
mmetsp:Transcript_23179/g.22658  ORF Transcript_23179/g.22658 Transcript_23179/m.22658 type:complete len:273 (-) Transcript_23179:3288-4106(-)